MTEFKQIIGRGTRLRKDKGKWHLEILDFRNATANSKTQHLTVIRNRQKEVGRSRSHTNLLTLLQHLCLNLVRNISSMVKIFV